MNNQKYTKSIVIDLDGTICFDNPTETNPILKIRRAIPNHDVINELKIFHNEGYYIIIHTDRGMDTFQSNIALIVKEYKTETENWLKFNSVPYDELIWGKPYASLCYISNKTIDQFQLEETFHNGKK